MNILVVDVEKEITDLIQIYLENAKFMKNVATRSLNLT